MNQPSMGRRIAARLLDGLVGVVVYVAAVALVLVAPPDWAWSVSEATGYRVSPGLVLQLPLLLVLGFALLALAVQLVKAATVGQLLLGLHNVDAVTGEPAGGRTLGKNVLIGLSSSLTCGLLPLVAALTPQQPGNRTMFDRAAGVVVRYRRAARSAGLAGGTPGVVAPAPAPEDGWQATPPSAPQSPAVAAPAWSATPAPVVAAPSPEPRPEEPQTGRTVLSAPISTPISAPAASSVPVGGRVVLDGVEPLDLGNVRVIGRDPVAPSLEPGATPVPLTDPGRSLSKTHLIVGRGPEGVWVVDLHSTNGVRTVRGGLETRVHPGERIALVPGDEVRFGTHTLRVVP